VAIVTHLLVDPLVAAHRELRRVLRRKGEHRAAPFRGWVTSRKAVVLGRVVEDDPGVSDRVGRAGRLARVTYERFGSVPAGGVEVRVSWEGRVVTTNSDWRGLVDVAIPVEHAPAARTTEVRLELDGQPARSAELFTSDPKAGLGVITDIDDTVLETEISNPWKRAMQLVYSEQRMRPPFDGVAALFRSFAEPGRPVFYVSNAPVTLYDHVAELLDQNGIVRGPLLLRDPVLVEGPRSHKQIALRRLVEDHPELTFVLIGDSTRRDPLRYVEVAESHPGRVAAIYIRKVTGLLSSRADLSELVERARRVGVELVIAQDTVTMAQHAQSRGFVTRTEVSQVREAKREDELTPPAAS
jgi:phosphatidate phosphatase APP1